MRVVDLRSDTVTKPSPEMWEYKNTKYQCIKTIKAK